MKTCGYCGRENEDEAALCSGCGLTEFADLGAADDPVPETQEESQPEPPTPDVSPDQEAAICPFCMFPNSPTRQWCKQCDAPIMGVAFGPFESALSLGCMWRGAVQGRPKLFVLLAIWAYFFPAFLISTSFIILGLGSGFLPVVCLGIAYSAIDFTMLFKVTRNYFRIPKLTLDD